METVRSSQAVHVQFSFVLNSTKAVGPNHRKRGGSYSPLLRRAGHFGGANQWRHRRWSAVHTERCCKRNQKRANRRRVFSACSHYQERDSGGRFHAFTASNPEWSDSENRFCARPDKNCPFYAPERANRDGFPGSGKCLRPFRNYADDHFHAIRRRSGRDSGVRRCPDRFDSWQGRRRKSRMLYLVCGSPPIQHGGTSRGAGAICQEDWP